MANEIFKEIKTKIALKTLSYAEWDAIKDTYKPLKGEVCVCTIPEGNAAATTAPTVMFKVGDGTNFFGALKWASALAADVYGWAKENALFIHKDGTGNVVSGVEWDASLNGGKGGVKYTTAAVATAEGLEDLQEAVAAIEKDITDNRNAWVLDTDTRYSFSTDGDKLVVKKTLYTNGVAGAEEAVGTYEFLTADEVAETLKGYYTKGEADAKFVTGLAEGATNGTIKAVVNGVSGADVKVHGLQDAAYATVTSLNQTAKGYADDVLGKSTDGAVANTVYGAKAAAAAAQNDATIAKTKIETFLSTVTPDSTPDIIDTLTEINSYIGEHGEEFAALSGKVTNIENGTTVVPKAANADHADSADEATHAVNADNAADAAKLGGQLPSHYATKESVDAIPDAIDSKISAYDAGKTFGDIITHNVAEFATSDQGDKADSALQEIETGTGLKVSEKNANKQTIEIDTDVVFVLDCNW